LVIKLQVIEDDRYLGKRLVNRQKYVAVRGHQLQLVELVLLQRASALSTALLLVVLLLLAKAD
jgi:hypothetical protein